ncbi:MAG: type IV toxin-antitoxin system AbiEi family antitoxin domain-containing protein [Armatimonadetes bacterium]|nr:type IV toxin-antitoxin system AbiEi family antitoxin domain-containing protein [Armatimonadota bacterium]
MPRKTANPNPARLFQFASVQAGYFTADQARASGYTKQNVAYHVRSGRFERIARGFYRFRDFPSSPHEDIIAAWVKAGSSQTVVSHETALALYELSTVRPQRIDLTVLRARRPSGDRPRLPAVRIHTTSRPFKPGEVIQQYGVRLTAPARTIADAAESGTDPAHIVEAVAEALGRGVITVRELEGATRNRSQRVRRLIAQSVEEARESASIR